MRLFFVWHYYMLMSCLLGSFVFMFQQPADLKLGFFFWAIGVLFGIRPFLYLIQLNKQKQALKEI